VLGDDVGLDLGGALPHEDWQADDPEVPSVTRIGKPGGKFDDSHKDWDAGAPRGDDRHEDWQRAGHGVNWALVEANRRGGGDGAAEGAAASAGRLVGVLASAADGVDEDVEGAVAADAR